jgi:hypothetical protein
MVLWANGGGTALQIVPSTRVVDFKVTPTLNSVAIPTISSTDTLTNKTLSSPTLSGTVSGSPAWPGRQDFGNEVTVTGANNQYAFGVRNRSTAGYFYQGATNSATPDYVFSRNAGDAVLTLGQDLSVTSAGALNAGSTIKTATYTVAGLPTPATGMRTMVTNALAPTFGSAVAGGGAVTVPVFYNGSAWIVG